MNALLKKSLLRRALEVVIVFGLAVAVGFAWHFATDARRRLHVAQYTLQQLPEQASARVQLEKELRSHEHDVARVEKLLVERRGLGEVIAAIEAVGAKRRIQVQVANVTAEEEADQAGPVDGILIPVRLTLSAAGSAEALLRFLSDVEHLPYVLHVDSLDLTSLAANSTTRALNLPVPSVSPDGTDIIVRESALTSQLSTDVILMIRNDAPH